MVLVSFGKRRMQMSNQIALYELLLSLQRKEICLEVEKRIYRGELVYVGDVHNSRQSYATIKDVFNASRSPAKRA